MERIQAEYQALEGFQSRFEQEDLHTDGTLLKAKGEVAYLKPGRMRWQYDPPNEQLLITDGKTVWLFDPILDNVTVQSLDEVTGGTPLSFLLGAGNLEKDFACRPLSKVPPSDGLDYLELVPHKKIPTLSFIQLGVTPRSDRIASIRMVDTRGNIRWIKFLQWNRKGSFPKDYFTFQVTPEMEVITKSGQ